MDYQHTFKKIFFSQYLFTGLRITAAAIIPALILYHYNVLSLMTAIPLGALVVGSTDSPGPFQHRRNTILASICINFLVVIITISLNHNPVFITLFIVLFGMFFSLIGIYGNRANSVGLIALLVFIFNIDSKASFGSVWFNGLLFTAGGACYFIMSLVLHRLRPYRYLQLQLGESLRTISDYIETLSGLFKTKHDDDYLFSRLRQQQITIQQGQDSLREMLLSTREMIADTTVKGRIIMMMFLDSIDLLEQLISLQQDYSDLYKQFNDSELLSNIQQTLHDFSTELNAIGYAVQFNQHSHSHIDIDKILQQLFNSFIVERKKHLNKNTLTSFIKMRQIIYALQDVGERIKRLHHFSGYEKMSTRQYKRNADEEPKIKSNEISPALLLENITFKSSQFNHALRVTIALLVGYAVSFFFPLGHGYWILMTIVIILKPAYSISRTRNKQRLLGTITGVALGFTFLYFIKNNTLEFLILICAMVIAYSLLKVNYYVSCVCITIYVLISFHFLNNSNFTVVIEDRLIDTVIACAIAFIISLTVFPVWEHEQTKELISKLIAANKKYFNAVTALLKSSTKNEALHKPARKDAFVALANLSDNFQRTLSEKRRNEHIAFYHQFVSSSYMLTAHIASLSTLLNRYDDNLNAKDFDALINNVNDKFKRTECVLKNEALKTAISNRNAPITNKVQTLLQQRQKEIEAGIKDAQTETRVNLRDLKNITDEFEIIDSIVRDEIKIVQKIMQ
ncbi:MAG: FUSC family membrane protein [Parafilimonas sp.]